MTKPVIAVTGATGFIGSRLVETLVQKGYAVRALARRIPEAMLHRDAIWWVTGSLENEAALAALLDGADAVVHCAGAIKARDRDAFFDVNVAGTRRLALRAVEKVQRPKFIHISSLAAREPTISSYAASKRAAEQALRGFANALDVVVLRPPAVYGPGDRETLRIFSLVERGFLPVPMGHDARISLVHVDDAVAAVLAVLDRGGGQDGGAAEGPIEFDDGHPGGYRWDEIAAAAGAAIGKHPRLIPMPAFALYAAGAVGSIAGRLNQDLSLLSWGKVAEFLHSDWAARGPAPAGYKPLWPIEKGFQDAVKWYRSRGLLKSNG